MTDKERYERAMRQDYPKDFIDDEWDFIEALASAKSDGVKNKSKTACRMPKSGGVRTMAKQDNMTRTVQEKCDYYKGRVNDKKLSEKQRQYAQRRLNQLCAGGNSKNKSTGCTNCSHTEAQIAAYNAGRVYGMAKTGKRVPVRPENQSSFRAGVDRERGKKGSRTMY